MAANNQLETTRVGFCAIVGLPNVGKSTLLNQLLGKRLVAVSDKPQTTRNRIIGVLNVEPDDGPAQIVFVDTPGLQKGKGALRKFMRDEVMAATGDCDAAVLVVDISRKDQRSPEALSSGELGVLHKALQAASAPTVLVLNKVDQIEDKATLLPLIEAFGAAGHYAAIVPMSAKRGQGVDALAGEVAKLLPAGPRLFPEEMYTDRAERFLAAELVREQLFRQLGEEVPYATACVVESWNERPDKGDVVIDAVIFVERDSQKAIVVGKGGQRIRTVGERAREAIGELLGCPVHLKLFVKVKSNWSREPDGIRDLGYES